VTNLTCDPRCELMLQVDCLGTFRIAGDEGWELGPQARPVREFVQYLILHAHATVPRDRLIDVLWPGVERESLPHRLHVAASSARAYLRHFLDGADALRCGAEGYSWNPHVRIVCDVTSFVGFYRDGTHDAMRAAVQLYGGELLSGEQSEWLLPARVRYAMMYASMTERLAERALVAGENEDALEHALTLLEIDRANEGASRLVMRAFAALGRRAQALAEYGALRAYLRTHLGVEPMPDTIALAGTIVQLMPSTSSAGGGRSACRRS
jgi:DNA-binding SARP family transcriptional activator